MAILPDGFHHDHWRVHRNVPKNFYAILLRIDEAMLLHSVDGMPPLDLKTKTLNGLDQALLDLLLRGPTLLVGGQPKVPVSDEDDGFWHIKAILADPGWAIAVN